MDKVEKIVILNFRNLVITLQFRCGGIVRYCNLSEESLLLFRNATDWVNDWSLNYFKAKNAVFWVVTPCRSCVNRLSRWVLTRGFFYLKMEETRSSETSVHTRYTRRHIPEDGILHRHLREHFKSCIRYGAPYTGSDTTSNIMRKLTLAMNMK
jgi:hypothetical protein